MKCGVLMMRDTTLKRVECLGNEIPADMISK
jgi:hypothetical protein